MKKKTAVQSAQLQQLLSASYIALITSTLLATILAYMQYRVIMPSVVIAWYSLVVLVAFSRVVLVVAYQRSPSDDYSTTGARLVRFRIGVFVAGLVWGSAGVLMYPHNDPQHQIFLIFMLAGLSAGGVISYSADFVSAIVFSISVIMPLVIRLFVAGDNLSLAMGIAGILYLGFIITSLRHINRNLIENIALNIEVSAREEAVRVSEDRYRLLLNHSPVGIFHYDTNLIITYCNNHLADILNNSSDDIINLDMKVVKDQSILPSLGKALAGEIGYYEGYYSAAFCDAKGWIDMTCAPSRDGSGKVVGGIAILQDITERKRAADEIEYLAFYDSLTRLPNRRLLFDRLKCALATSARSGRDGALLFLDIDNFKMLNDSHGHDIGDLLLKQVAERLLACLRAGDTAARFGGDEFVIMLEDLSEQPIEAATQVDVIGNKILTVLNQPYQLGMHEYHGTSSIGVALFRDHEQSHEDLLKHADIAMYQAKKTGRNTMRFFDPQMQSAINVRTDLERELRKALEQQQFQLYYQIQVDSAYCPLGAEVLIRWLHPERGLVSPLEFIPLAEETGLILPIGRWVLETACAQLKAWQQDVLTRNLTLSVNVSAKQFRQSDFVAQVQATIQRHAINPMKLKLELTESILLEHIEDTIATMNALKDMAIQFSLDDFGTGYSSLQYLKRLPIYQLKIDQSFVRDIATQSSDQAIVRTIIAMAQTLNLNVIAEGVETEEQRQLLHTCGCSTYQGYLFGKPVPIALFEAALRL